MLKRWVFFIKLSFNSGSNHCLFICWGSPEIERAYRYQFEAIEKGIFEIQSAWSDREALQLYDVCVGPMQRGIWGDVGGYYELSIFRILIL